MQLVTLPNLPFARWFIAELYSACTVLLNRWEPLNISIQVKSLWSISTLLPIWANFIQSNNVYEYLLYIFISTANYRAWKLAASCLRLCMLLLSLACLTALHVASMSRWPRWVLCTLWIRWMTSRGTFPWSRLYMCCGELTPWEVSECTCGAGGSTWFRLVAIFFIQHVNIDSLCMCVKGGGRCLVMLPTA